MQSAETRREWVLAALDQYEVRLLRYTLRLLGGDLDAGPRRGAACVPETVRANRRIRSTDRLAAWLFRVCRNRAVDHLRQAGREQSLVRLSRRTKRRAHASLPRAGPGGGD